MARTASDNVFTRPLGPVASAGWSAAFLMVFVFIGSVAAAIKPGTERDGVVAALLYTASALLVLLIVVRVHAPDAELRDVVGARPIGFLSALLAAVVGACSYFPLGALEALLTRKFMSVQEAAEYAKALSEVGHRERIAGTLALSLVAPVADELFFRGALVSGLVRGRGADESPGRGKLLAAVVTSVTFALVSSANDLHYVPLYVLMGLVLVHARLATGSVLGAIAAHLGFRGAELAQAVRTHGTIDPFVTGDVPSVAPVRVLAVATGLALLFGLLLLRVGEGEKPDATHTEDA